MSLQSTSWTLLKSSKTTTTTSPLLGGGTSSSETSDGTTTALFDGGGGYDSISQLDDLPPPNNNNASNDNNTITDTENETQVTHTLLDNVHARYSVTDTIRLCIFEEHESWNTGTATILNEILNLFKNIVGSGGLSLPGGIATFGNMPSAIIPSLVVIFIMAIINAYSFSLLGRVCHVTKSTTYQQIWDRSVGRRYGPKYNIFVGLVVTFKAVLGCWSFSIVIASTCQPLIQHIMSMINGDGNEHEQFHISKSETLSIITIFILLPLCLTFRLSSLAGFSFVGSVGTCVTAFTMALRYYDGSYLPNSGKFYDDVPSYLQPKFGNRSDVDDDDLSPRGAISFFTSPQSLILVSILSQG